MNLFLFIALGMIAYLIGSVNTSIVISKLMGEDIREHGSGNAGMTNTLRTYGKKVAALVFLGDALKGVVAMLMVMPFDLGSLTVYLPYFAGICVILGHNFPIYFHFKGGKGILTSAVVIAFIDWRMLILELAIFILFMILTRIVSLSSIMCAAGIIIACWIMPDPPGDVMSYRLLFTAMGILAIIMHRKNLVRLYRGEEKKVSFHKKEEQA